MATCRTGVHRLLDSRAKRTPECSPPIKCHRTTWSPPARPTCRAGYTEGSGPAHAGALEVTTPSTANIPAVHAGMRLVPDRVTDPGWGAGPLPERRAETAPRAIP